MNPVSSVNKCSLFTLNVLYVYYTVLQLHVSTNLRIYVDLAHTHERKVTLMRCDNLVTNLYGPKLIYFCYLKNNGGNKAKLSKEFVIMQPSKPRKRYVL